jgi:hypothetical protein
MDTHLQGNYAMVNGLDLYYESHGSGQPLVLLPGGYRASVSISTGTSIVPDNERGGCG